MFQNNLISLTEDPTLPDLLLEDPMINDLFRIDDLPTPIIHPNIAEINRKLEHLTLETNASLSKGQSASDCRQPSVSQTGLVPSMPGSNDDKKRIRQFTGASERY